VRGNVLIHLMHMCGLIALGAKTNRNGQGGGGGEGGGSWIRHLTYIDGRNLGGARRVGVFVVGNYGVEDSCI